MQYIMGERYSDKPEEDEATYGEEEEEDYDEEAEEKEEDEDAEPDYGDYGDYGEYDKEIDDQPAWPGDETIPHIATGDRYFIGDQTNKEMRD